MDDMEGHDYRMRSAGGNGAGRVRRFAAGDYMATAVRLNRITPKVHRSWSIVESRRCADRKVVHRHVLYLLRTNLAVQEPDTLWRYYMQLVFVEEAFRTLKGDLGLRPIFHKKAGRTVAHLFVAFLAYCLSVTLRQQLRTKAAGLMPRGVLEKLATVEMLDMHIPTRTEQNGCSAGLKGFPPAHRGNPSARRSAIWALAGARAEVTRFCFSTVKCIGWSFSGNGRHSLSRLACPLSSGSRSWRPR
jgi:hypothetical protein